MIVQAGNRDLAFLPHLPVWDAGVVRESPAQVPRRWVADPDGRAEHPLGKSRATGPFAWPPYDNRSQPRLSLSSLISQLQVYYLLSYSVYTHLFDTQFFFFLVLSFFNHPTQTFHLSQAVPSKPATTPRSPRLIAAWSSSCINFRLREQPHRSSNSPSILTRLVMADASCSGGTPFKRLIDHQSRDVSHHQDRLVDRSGAQSHNVSIRDLYAIANLLIYL